MHTAPARHSRFGRHARDISQGGECVAATRTTIECIRNLGIYPTEGCYNGTIENFSFLENVQAHMFELCP